MVLFVTSLIFSCKKKKEENNETPVTYTPAPATPVKPVFAIGIPGDADGVLNASLIPYTFSSGGFTTKVGNATAFFYKAPGDYNYIDAGTVKCNDSTLTKLSGGSYSFNGTAINGQAESGINYSSGAIWTGGGTSAVPAFTIANTIFPTDATITSATTFTHNASYNLTFSGVANADSVQILFGCDSVLILKTVNAAVTSYSYSAAEVASVKKKFSGKKGYFTFTPCKLTPNSISGKKYYSLNSTTKTYTVTIQ
jgi:hypothetical protein